jgi:hypothetical protein
MNRVLIALLAAVSTAVMSEELRIVRLVDLDAPGALELVQREHPDHIVKIQRILREAPDQSPDEAPGWMRTQFGASGVGYGILRTSDPPKANLSFVLGDTAYSAVITLRNARPQVLFPRNNEK